jgi:oxalate decarboxylase/phosphoglucose isomerase-like protein (cupin superfamily)
MEDGQEFKRSKVEAGKDRFQEELLIMGGRFDCKVSGKDTDGDLCIYDTVRQEKGDPTLHLHYNQDEWFYIIKGEFIGQN